MASWLFGKKKTPAELLRENKRMLERAIRELDRERMGLQNQEKKLIQEIKKMAKEGQMVRLLIMHLSSVCLLLLGGWLPVLSTAAVAVRVLTLTRACNPLLTPPALRTRSK
jgi:intein/homing endonuclease